MRYDQSNRQKKDGSNMRNATWMLVTAVALWGVAIAPTKWALEDVGPASLMFLRLFVAGGLFFVFSWLKQRPQVPIPWLRITLLSFTGVGGYFLFTSYGIDLTSGLHASIIDAALPLVSILFAATVLRERIGPRHVFAMLVGFAGVLLIALPTESGDDSASLLGDLLIFGSTILFALYTVLLKRPRAEAQLPGTLLTALLLLAGSLLVLPFALVETWRDGLPDLSAAKTVWSLLYLTVGASMAAYFLWNKALETVSATVSGLYMNLLPLISILASVVLLHETMTWRIWAGACLVFLGVFQARTPAKEKQKEKQEATT